MRGLLPLLLTLIAAATPRSVACQPMEPAGWSASWQTPVLAPFANAQTAHPLKPAALSALLPGAGQFTQGRRRWIVFLAAEAAAWAFHLDARQDGRRLRAGYRDLAWAVGRGAPEPRVDGAFEYYERMAFWTRSGAFDSDPGSPELDPERDPSTYNGAQWALAASIFLQGDPHTLPGAPGYDQALEYYRDRAYEAAFAWDWSDAGEDHDRFRGLIDESDDRFRTASVALALVAGNHLLSAVDAFAAARVGASGLRLRFEPGPWPGARPYVAVRFPLR